MALNYVNITRKDLGRGVDTFSPKGSLPDGYAEDLQNLDTNASGRLSTRRGYEGYAGWVPFRVSRIDHAGAAIRLQFADSQQIDLSTALYGPVIVQGHLSSQAAGAAGDFLVTTDTVHWYSGFALASRVGLSGTGTVTRTAGQHGYSHEHLLVGLAEVTSESNPASDFSNNQLMPDDVKISTTTYQVDVDYTVGTPRSAYLYFRDVSTASGEVYREDVSTPTTSVVVPASTSLLNNFNILVYAFDTTTNPKRQVIPDSWVIDTAGQVTVTFTTAFTGQVYLVSAPLAQSLSTSAPAPGSHTFTLTSPGGPFVFAQVYRVAGGGNQESVLPDSVSYDDATDTTTIGYTLAGAAEGVNVYWVTGATNANSIELQDTGSVSETYTDTAPQLTVWGLDHGGVYRTPANPGGHVTHLDTYRRVGEARVVCGLGGNVFKAATYEESASDYVFGSLYTNLHARIDSTPAASFVLAPLFYSGAPPARSRGTVVDSSVEDCRALVTAATYVSSGVVDYTLTFTGKTGSVSSGIATGLDRLTVSQLAHAEHTGTWVISTVVSETATQVVLRVANPNVVDTTSNETGARGRAGVFTDRFTTESLSNLLPDDVLIAGAVPDDVTCTIVAVNGSTIYVDGVTEALTFPDGLRVNGRRASRLIPLRETGESASVTGFVRGDMLAVSGLARRVRVTGVQPAATQTVTFPDHSAGILTLTAGAAHGLNPGDTVALYNHTTLAGEHTVLTAPTTTTFTLAATASAGSATLQGRCIQLDEVLTVEDGNDVTTFTVDARWIPLEAPTTAFDLPAKTYYRHLDANEYDQQPALRSTLLNDSMYFVNGADEVHKFDGNSLYRAGLPKWQAGLFVQNNTGATVKISTGLVADYTESSATAKRYKMTLAPFSPGDRVVDSNVPGSVMTVLRVEPDVTGANTYVYVLPSDPVTNVSSGTPTLSKVLVYKYYVRLNAVDPNGFVIASASVQSEDLVVDYRTAGELNLRLVPPPAFGALDYDTIEVQVYRTRADRALYHLQSRRFVDFDRADAYIDIVDSIEDVSLGSDGPGLPTNTDPVLSALLGAELGTAWEAPPRAKHITSLDNRLLLGNVRGWPEVDLTFRPLTTGASTLPAASLADKLLTFRRDGTDVGTSTDNTNRVRFQFRTSGAVTITTGGASTTSFTVNTASPPAVGSWVYLFHSNTTPVNNLRFAGWWQVASISPGVSFTVSFNHSGAAWGGTDVDRYVTAATSTDVPVWIGTDGNYGQRDGNPSADDYSIQVATRLAAAINATQRATTTTGFTPWLSAFAGQDYGIGQLIVRTPGHIDTTPEVELPASFTSDFTVYANAVEASNAAAVAFRTAVWPSRLLRSYKNYPEIFDAPFTDNPNDSDSIIDINPADGQEITAILPFFGISSTGSSSQLSQELVVFKSASIYLVNIDTRTVQRIDSRGLGCTAPRSVTVTQSGVIFANPSGIYRLNRDMSITHIGRALAGVWSSDVALGALSEASGHHYATGRRYKLSVPVAGGYYPSRAYVYDYDREGQDQPVGAWTVYTAHDAVGWCNLDSEAYWASTAGDVFLVRNRQEASDYRDEADAVAEQVATLRAEDFDLPGVRKAVASVTTLVELNQTDLTGLTVEVAQNLSSTFASAGSVTLERSEFRQHTFRATPPARRGTYFQVRYRHSAKDEALELTGVAYQVAQLSGKLTPDTEDH